MEVVKVLHEMPKPTIAVMPGPAAGAGLSLALACDLRICVSTAKVTTAFSKIAVSGDYGGSYFLSKLVGTARARELYFTADVLTGDQALAMGIVTKVAPPEEFAAAAEAYVRYLASLPTLAVGYMKRNLNISEHGTLSELLDLEAMHMARTMMTEDHKAASIAFVEKRPPVFNGH
jgi:2-(1,2-epoxy-1,2-dihydrophenyl)acetyl-CoA isomerase